MTLFADGLTSSSSLAVSLSRSPETFLGCDSIRNMRSFVVNSIPVLLILLAVLLDVQDLNCIDEMGSHMKRALEYHVVAVVESMEANVILSQAEYEEQEADQFQARARQFFAQGALEEGTAQGFEAKAQHYEQLAAQELSLVNSTVEQIGRDETLRADIVKNISLDRQRKNDLDEDLRHIQEGGCAYAVVRWLCDIVGGTVELQREADEEALQIQQDMALLQEVDRQEYAEKVVAQALQGNATKFLQTATDLVTAAQYWEKIAQQDYAKGSLYNETGNKLAAISGLLEKRGERDYEYRTEYIQRSNQEIKESVALYKQSVQLATAAVTLALMAIYFVTAKVLRHVLYVCRSTNQFLGDPQTTETELWRRVSALALHVAVFLATIGYCGPYVSRIQEYELRQRAAIVSWVSVVASLLQTLIFQAIPHCSADWPLRRRDLLVIAKYSALRLLSLFVLTAIEVLIVITTFPFMVSSGVTAWWGQPAIVVMVLAMSALYLYVFEPRGSSGSCSTISSLASDDASRNTAWLSEVTPLASGREDVYTKRDMESPGSTAVALLNMDLGTSGRGCREEEESAQHVTSMDSWSPYYWNADVEFRRLAVAFDLLMACILIGVLMDCLPILYHYNPVRVIVPLSVLAVTAVAVAAALFVFRTMRERRSSSRKTEDVTVIEIGSVPTCGPSFASSLHST